MNDQLGHAQGDALLVKVAATLKRVLRSTDLVARMGGDEFAICLPDTPLQNATTLLEGLRLTLSRLKLEKNQPLSASIGAVCWQHPPDNMSLMLAEADRLMYLVKNSGKNRVEIAAVTHP